MEAGMFLPISRLTDTLYPVLNGLTMSVVR